MPAPGKTERLSPLVRRLTQDNPSVFTGAGTNTHLVGRTEVFILDPGADDEAHFERIVEAVGDARVLGVIPTHHHGDHWPLAPRLAAHFGAPTMGFGPEGDYAPERRLADGQILHATELTLEAIHTPGHAPDHLCYLLREEQTLFSGDHVMGWSTSVIAPPGGNLNQFMASLERLRRYHYERMLPAHGLPIEEPYERIDELWQHRHERTRQAVEALEGGLTTIPEMVAEIYADVDPRLHVPAGWSLLAHLLALVEEGRARHRKIAENPIESEWELAP
jgi:glyoxylase-like metal-dependent hydrolase (beta-lactamase superfamily II)